MFYILRTVELPIIIGWQRSGFQTLFTMEKKYRILLRLKTNFSDNTWFGNRFTDCMTDKII
jgi:hypothetical protein